MQDLEWYLRRRFVTISDLKEVLRAKTEEKDRPKESEASDMGRATTLENVLSNNSQHKKSSKTLPET